MKWLKFFVFILSVYHASAFNPRGLANNTLQQQEKETGIYARITHGFLALSGQFPYQVCLLKVRGNRESTAGGSLIRNNWVLTAAHSTIDAHIIHVFLGQIRLQPQRSYTTVHKPSPNVIEHYGYNRTTMLHYIALIRIPLSYFHVSAFLAGWGKTSDRSNGSSSTLQFGIFKVISNADCAASYDEISMSVGKLCTETSGRTSGCEGDSVGSLVLAGSKIQIGILSFGADDGCELGYPMAFTRVDHYLDWIRGYINKLIN